MQQSLTHVLLGLPLVGASVGDREVESVGERVGASVGLVVGLVDGLVVGVEDGLAVGPRFHTFGGAREGVRD